MNIQSNKISFKSGLTPNIRRIIKQADIGAIEDGFKNYGVDANFKGDKILASYFAMVLNVFEELSEKYKLPFSALPPRIRTFDKKDLIKEASDSFCLPDTGLVLKSELPFELRSIFMKRQPNLTIADKKIDDAFKVGGRSSSHFLSDAIHEWCHNVHLDLIFKRNGYDGVCPYGKEMYPRFFPMGLKLVQSFSDYNPNPKMRTMIQQELGNYAATSNSKMEVFAEGLTKLITNSLDTKTLKVKKNPLDGLSVFPKKLRKLIEGQLD